VTPRLRPQTIDLKRSALLESAIGHHQHQVYERLIDYDRNGELKPKLATSWKRVDATTWEFELRRGVTFHDGTPYNSADVLFSFQCGKADNSSVRDSLGGIGRSGTIATNALVQGSKEWRDVWLGLVAAIRTSPDLTAGDKTVALATYKDLRDQELAIFDDVVPLAATRGAVKRRPVLNLLAPAKEKRVLENRRVARAGSRPALPACPRS
jgi:hypothetical protein